MKNRVKSFIKKKYKHILIGVVITFVTLIIVIISGFFVIKFSGQKSLNKDAIVEGKAVDGTSIDSVIKYKGKSYKYKDGIINILCLGIDKSSDMTLSENPGYMGQSDAIFLVSIDTKNDAVSIIAIPRDTMLPVQIYNADNQYYNMKTMQIAVQYAFGNNSERSAELTTKAISGLLYNIPIQRYCAVNLNTVSILNDAVGGVKVTIENDFTDEQVAVVDKDFVKGNTVTLNGEQALKFIQERDCSLFASSMDRLSRQSMYIDSFMEIAQKAIKKNVFIPIHVYNKIRKNNYISTDIKGSEATYLATKMLDITIRSDDIVTVPGEVKTGEVYEEYNVNNEALKEIIMDTFYAKVN